MRKRTRSLAHCANPKKVLVVAVDLSYSSTGMIAMDSDYVYEQRAIVTKSTKTPYDHRERIIHIATEVEQFVQENSPELVVIEGYAYSAVGNAVTMAELGGVVRCRLHSIVNLLDVAPSTLKKFVCLGKERKKENVLLDAYKRWGVSFESNDLCDAYVLARIGVDLLTGNSAKSTNPQKEVIASLLETFNSNLTPSKSACKTTKSRFS